MPRQLGIHMQENQVGPLPHALCKNELKWITDLQLRAKTIKILEDIGVNVHDLGISNGFPRYDTN